MWLSDGSQDNSGVRLKLVSIWEAKNGATSIHSLYQIALGIGTLWQLARIAKQCAFDLFQCFKMPETIIADLRLKVKGSDAHEGQIYSGLQLAVIPILGQPILNILPIPLNPVSFCFYSFNSLFQMVWISLSLVSIYFSRFVPVCVNNKPSFHSP